MTNNNEGKEMTSKNLREQFEKSTEVETLIAIARESIEALEKSENTVKLLRGIIQKYEYVLISRIPKGKQIWGDQEDGNE